MKILMTFELLVSFVFCQYYQVAETRVYEVDISVFNSTHEITDTLFLYQELGLEVSWSSFIPVGIQWDDDVGNTRTTIQSSDGFSKSWNVETAGNLVTIVYEVDNDNGLEWIIWQDNPYFFFTCNDMDCQDRSGSLLFKLEAIYDNESFGGLNGDWNNDGEVNIVDIVMIVDYILQG